MQSENRLLEDLTRVLNGAAGTFAGMTREAQAGLQERMRDWVGGMDLVRRDEFEAVRAMAIAARDENDLLRARLETLEASLPPGAAAARPDLDKSA